MLHSLPRCLKEVLRFKKGGALTSISFVILFTSFSFVILSHRLFDSDFWWHISTGRYIIETGTIPDKDPFSYTSNLQENKNLFPKWERLILKQYWLAQIIFYLVYDHTGAAGIIALRTFLLTIVVLMVFWRMKRWGVSFYISFIYTFLLYLVLLKSVGERPVLFTIVFTVLTFIILEEFREKKGKLLFLLPFLMLLWSNLHGGFIIGNTIIMVYMFVEGLKIALKRARYAGGQIAILYSASALALISSYINPAGWDAFSIILSPKYRIFESGIQEYQPLFLLIKEKVAPVNYGYVALVLMFPLILVLRNRRLDLTHIVLLSGLFIMALKAGRFAIYYASIATMVLGKETDALLENLFKGRLRDSIYTKLIYAFSIVALVSSISYFSGVFRFEVIRYGLIESYSYTVPKRAIDFIEENTLPGNIFHSHNYGGYLTWRLYPSKKTFIDTRWLNYTVRTEYGFITTAKESISGLPISYQGNGPLWKGLLNHYNINLILLDPLDYRGDVNRLLLALAEDKEWVPIYCDPIAIIFIKNLPKNHDIIEKFKRPKDNVYNAIIFIASQMAIYDRLNPRYLVSLGEVFYNMGRSRDALTAYQYAHKRFPDDLKIKEKIAQIESELESGMPSTEANKYKKP